MKLAQYRFLSRVLRGERLPGTRFFNASIAASVARGDLHAHHGRWAATEAGTLRFLDQKPKTKPAAS
jgi:hypothetical protein